MLGRKLTWTRDVYPGLQITWSDRYSMAATRDEHMSGGEFAHSIFQLAASLRLTTCTVRFSMAVNESDIRLKQKYTLPNGWRNGEVEDDGSLGAGSLSFRNGGGDEASAILLQRIQGRATPIYISGRPVSGGGTQTLTPTQEIAVWVDRNAETGTMISRNSGSQATFNMAGRSNLEAKWTGSRFEA